MAHLKPNFKSCSEYLKLEEQYSELMFNYKILLKENNGLRRKISFAKSEEIKSVSNTNNLSSILTQTESKIKEFNDVGTNTVINSLTHHSKNLDGNESDINNYSTSLNNVEGPCVLFPGHPFSSFSVEMLDREITYSHSLENRQLMYYGEYPYMYGSITHEPCSVPENSYVNKIINHVSKICPQYQFNSVLVTKFDNGKSFLPMHSDNENVIHPDSTILTVSLGETRSVKFQHLNQVASPECSVNVSHGDVYAMTCKSQSLYKHGIPKDYSKGSRLSLTFRLIVSVKNNSNMSRDSVEQILPNTEECLSSSSQSTPVAPRACENTGQTYSSVSSSSVPDINKTTSQSEVDTVYISSSMFRELNEEKLSTTEHCSNVFYFPGATANGILRKLQENDKFKTIDPVKVKQVFLMCGTNDIDNILNIKRSDHNNVNVTTNEISHNKLQRSLNDICELTRYLHQTFELANLKVLNILPRNSRLRNEVINNINSYLKSLSSNTPYLTYINTEFNFNLFSDVNGYRKNDFFKSVGSDNVHLSRRGVTRLGKHLKYLAHN